MDKYYGRHRKPSTSGRTAARIAVIGVTATAPIGISISAAEAAAPPEIANAIASCESSGNPTAQNDHSTASGLFQFINGTWRAYGGSTLRAKDASVAEQWQVFERAYAAEGTGPWISSKPCWSKRIGSAPAVIRSGAAPTVAAHAAVGNRGTYTCDNAHLYFEACDPGNLGQVVAYPGGTAVQLKISVGSGRAANGSGTYTCDPAHYLFEACDPGDEGQVKQYPLYR